MASHQSILSESISVIFIPSSVFVPSLYARTYPSLSLYSSAIFRLWSMTTVATSATSKKICLNISPTCVEAFEKTLVEDLLLLAFS